MGEGHRDGATTRQMREAPQGAVFVWCNSHLHYPKALASALGRKDLDVQPLSWLDRMEVVAGNTRPVVVDHAAILSSPQKEAFWHAVRRSQQGVAR